MSELNESNVLEIAEMLVTATENVEKVYDSGRQSEYDAFWEAFQQTGTRNNYSNAFRNGWDDTNFNPKYDIKPIRCDNAFTNSNITDIAAMFEKNGIVLDTSQSTDVKYMFTNMYNTLRIPTVSAEAAISLEGTFGWSRIETIDKLILRNDGTNTFTDTFNSTTQLMNITIEGVIGNDINFRWCTKLSRASIESIVNHLSDAAIGKTLTLSEAAVDTAFSGGQSAPDPSTTTEIGSSTVAWFDLYMSKPNWTITLV
ncbi:MAG: hypothetical protein E7611_06850 [Ruminococcaceae bacterium]|nr:hypothetical protein [Oscillospiraceae bacterium]